MSGQNREVVTEEWVTFPGGELEGKRPKALCGPCREALKREAATYGTAGVARRSRLLCFDCYRADLARARAMKAAGELDTATDARFQSQLPFEPVNHARLDMLKAERGVARTAMQRGSARDGQPGHRPVRRQAASRADSGASRTAVDCGRSQGAPADARGARADHGRGDSRRRTAAARGVAAVRGLSMNMRY